MPEDTIAAYAMALRALHKAAGSPTGHTIRRQAELQRPPLKVTESSWSDWLRGKNVPASKVVANFVVSFLRGRSKQETPGYVAPPEGWWEEMRLRALAERRAGPGRGGRPRRGETSPSEGATTDRCRIGVIPRQADCFQDRARNTPLAVAFAKGTEAPRCVLTGTGGVGKTQLAAQYARAAWAEGVEVLLWVPASSRRAILDMYASASVQLGLVNQQDVDGAAETFLVWAERTDRPWLVVLDDIQDLADVRSLWPPDSPVGRLMATTRRRDAAFLRQGQTVVEIETFHEEEALAFLRRKLGHLADDWEEAAELAADLGFLPLALAQATAFMLDRKMSCASYRRTLSSNLLEQTVPELGGLPDDHRQIVSATWDLSIVQANMARPTGLASPLLELLSFLDPNGIPVDVLGTVPAQRYLSERISDSFPEAAAPVDVTQTHFGATIEGLWVLHRFNIVDYDPGAEHAEIRVHRLVQRAARESLANSSESAAAQAAADALIAFWPDSPRDRLRQVLRANAAALWRTASVELWKRSDGFKVWRDNDVVPFIREISRAMNVTVRRGGAFVSENIGIGCSRSVLWNGGGYYRDLFFCGTTYPSGYTFYCSAKCFYSK